jgi:ligand-binding sensor domain-containing protein
MGQWRTHLPYNNIIALTLKDNKIYAAAPQSVFTFERDEQSVQRITKVNGLNGSVISSMNRIPQTDEIIIGYESGLLDVISGGKIDPLFEIQRYNTLGSKKINDFLILNNFVYISTDFGIVRYNPEAREFEGPYNIGSAGSPLSVNQTTTDGTHLYAGTEAGVYRADVNGANLLDFNSWEKIDGLDGFIGSIAYWKGTVYALEKGELFNDDFIYYYTNPGWAVFIEADQWEKSNIRVFDDQLFYTTYFGYSAYDTDLNMTYNFTQTSVSYPFEPFDVLHDERDNVWIADSRSGLIRNFDGFRHQRLSPESVSFGEAFSSAFGNGDFASVAGGKTTNWNNIFATKGVNILTDDRWAFVPASTLDSAFDILAITAIPGKKGEWMAGSWGRGLYHFTSEGVQIAQYDYTNSPLEENPGISGWTGIGDLEYDSEGRLWVTNPNSDNPLHMLTPSGNWTSYTMPGALSSSLAVGDLMIDSRGYKWLQRYRDGLVVYNDNNTPGNTNDDAFREISTGAGLGNLTSENVLSFAEDDRGTVWVGTDNGVATFFNARNIFEGGNFDAQHILIESDGFVEKLLTGESVTAIAVDGGNRKWFGTSRNGVFLLSDDATEEIYHFTEDNSPLLSNNIQDITINPNTGEVFFSTSVGLISFKSDASASRNSYDNVYVYPNPVRPEFEGVITIQNLIDQSDVYITDVAGNIVYRTVSEGGTAVWDGKNFEGADVASGVYLVMLNTPTGEQKAVTKILIVN